MNNKLWLGLGSFTIVFLLPSGSARSAARTQEACQASALAFEDLSLHLEVDLTSMWGVARSPTQRPISFLELPAEVVLTVSSERSFSRLRVSDSSQETVFELDLLRGTTCGLSEIELECEGATLGEVLADYPAGRYLVEATTRDGVLIRGIATLRPRFPGFFTAISPLQGEIVRADEVAISWTPSQGAARYVLEIEQEELGFAFEIVLPPEQTSFQVPTGVLRPGSAYEYSLVVQGDTDNELEVEGGFVTSR